MDPEHALELYHYLSMANKKVILGDDLHIIYQITPLPCHVRPPWHQYFDYVERMSGTRRDIIKLIGLDMGFLMQLSRGTNPSMEKVKERVRTYNDKSPVQSVQSAQSNQKSDGKVNGKKQPKRDRNGLTFDHKCVIAQRLWAAFMICDIVREIPSDQIARKWSVDKGLIQALQSSVSTFAGMVGIFCEKLNWFELRLMVAEYQERVQFGFISKGEERKLKPFFKLGHNVMTKTIARVLYDNGICNIEQLAMYKSEALQSILSESRPFQLKQHSGGMNGARRDGIDPRLGMKLVYLAQQWRNRKIEAKEKRLRKRSIAVRNTPGKDHRSKLEVPNSGTQYNRDHGYKVRPRTINNSLMEQQQGVQRLFHPNLHTQDPYSQLSAKAVPKQFLNINNDSLLAKKRFTPRQKSWCDATPNVVYGLRTVPSKDDSPNSNRSGDSSKSCSPLVPQKQKSKSQMKSESVNINHQNTSIIISNNHLIQGPPSKMKEDRKMSVDEDGDTTTHDVEPVEDGDTKQSQLTNHPAVPHPEQFSSQTSNKPFLNTSRTQPLQDSPFALSPLNAYRTRPPVQRCNSVPVISPVKRAKLPMHNRDVVDRAVLKEVFADFFSPASNANQSRLNRTVHFFLHSRCSCSVNLVF